MCEISWERSSCSHHTKNVTTSVDRCVKLSLEIISQCIHILKHHIVHLKVTLYKINIFCLSKWIGLSCYHSLVWYALTCSGLCWNLGCCPDHESPVLAASQIHPGLFCPGVPRVSCWEIHGGRALAAEQKRAIWVPSEAGGCLILLTLKALLLSVWRLLTLGNDYTADQRSAWRCGHRKQFGTLCSSGCLKDLSWRHKWADTSQATHRPRNVRIRVGSIVSDPILFFLWVSLFLCSMTTVKMTLFSAKIKASAQPPSSRKCK